MQNADHMTALHPETSHTSSSSAALVLRLQLSRSMCRSAHRWKTGQNADPMTALHPGTFQTSSSSAVLLRLQMSHFMCRSAQEWKIVSRRLHLSDSQTLHFSHLLHSDSHSPILHSLRSSRLAFLPSCRCLTCYAACSGALEAGRLYVL